MESPTFVSMTMSQLNRFAVDMISASFVQITSLEMPEANL